MILAYTVIVIGLLGLVFTFVANMLDVMNNKHVKY